MAGLFVAASSQYLSSASPLPTTGYPFTMAAWYMMTSAATTVKIAGLYRSNGGTNIGDTLAYDISASTTARIVANVAGVAFSFSFSVPTQTNFWNFVVLRCISATNRRAAVLAFSDGSITHVQDTTSKAPTTMDTVAVGALVSTTPTHFMNGMIGEFWYTNTDIQPDGLQLADGLVRQLAFGGPFSVPYIDKDIVDYRSCRQALDSSQDNLSDNYFMGNKGRRTWINNSGVTLGPHPPLPSWYRGPNDQIRIGVV